MAITSSAKKAIRSSARKAIFNLRRKNAISTIEKKIRKLVKDGKEKDARALLPSAYKVLDKAAKTKFVKKNTASRLKSRLTKLVNKMSKK